MWKWQNAAGLAAGGLSVCVCVRTITAQPQCFIIISSFHSVFRPLPLCCSSFASFHLQPRSQTSSFSFLPLSPYLSVSDEGMDLLSCLTVWAGLRVCSPSPLLVLLPPSLPPCLSACLAELPHHTSAQTTKTPFAASERVPACPGIPTGGENSLPHCYALIGCQVPFLFCSLVFLPPFSLIFSLCLFHSPLLCWQHPLCVLSRFPQ